MDFIAIIRFLGSSKGFSEVIALDPWPVISELTFFPSFFSVSNNDSYHVDSLKMRTP